MGLQKQHDILYFLLLNPALLDFIDSFRPDARDFGQAVRSVIKHIQGLLTENLNYPASVNRAYAFDKTAAEIFLNPINRRRQSLLTALEAELLSVLRIILPEAV